jgi:hypothetical protein
MAHRILRPKLIETTRTILMLVSLAGVIDAACAEPARTQLRAELLGAEHGNERHADRRLNDLARLDRRRREDQQQRGRRKLGLGGGERSACVLRLR